MGKKSSKLSMIYLIGVLLVVIGFCLPMFKGKLLGTTSNGFSFINFDNFGWSSLAAILIFAGALLGAIFCFVKTKNASLLKLICIIVSIVGGAIFFIKFSDNAVAKIIGKGFLKHAYIGFYAIVVGWIVGLFGAITHK